jgi:3-deoxy-D-arabino-heptulosonate 7-phosphate (DAHP) synthase class II
VKELLTQYMADELGRLKAEVASLREALAEVTRNLAFTRCSDCSDHFSTEPMRCLLADHIEAHYAVAKARALLASKTEGGGK